MGTKNLGEYLENLISFAFILAAFSLICEGASVTYLTPHTGSRGGQVRMTIYGSGFSADQFSQNDDPNTGNAVYLASESGSEYSCDILRNDCTEDQIACYTPWGLPEEDHYVKVVVDGIAVPDSQLCGGYPTSANCIFRPTSSLTPWIYHIDHQSGMPGENVVLAGRLFTDRFGSNVAAATNNRIQKILRVTVGPRECDLKDGDEFYGLALYSDTTDDGSMECKTNGVSLGFYNASFIAQSPFGSNVFLRLLQQKTFENIVAKSYADDILYRVSYNDQIFLYQIYADITNISHSVGSEAGGLHITIYGNYIDGEAPYPSPFAFVADTVCVIVEVVPDVSVECIVAADPQDSGPKFEGNRGVIYEYWISTSKDFSNIDSILSLTSADPGYNSTILDETAFDDAILDNYVSKMTTFFRPPHTGEYQFFLYADDGAKLFVDGVEAVSSSLSWQESSRMSLDENSKYLLEVLHFENVGDSFIYLNAKFYDTAFTRSWTAKAEQEMQTMQIRSTVTYDIQELEFSQFSVQNTSYEVQIVELISSGEFRFGLFGVYTEPLNVETPESTIQDALQELVILGSGESILVERNETEIPTYILTFMSNRGDFPDIEVVKVDRREYLSYNVTEEVQGVPDLDSVALEMDGVVSAPFSVSELDLGTLTQVVTGMFSSRCPSIFEGPGLAIHYENFEGGSSRYVGSIVKDTESFCGNYVLKNPTWNDRIYKRLDDESGIPLQQYGTVCFAYKGFLSNEIGLWYSYRDSDDLEIKTSAHEFYHAFQTDSSTVSNTWYYTCVDIYAIVYGLRSGHTEHTLHEVWVYRANGGVDAFVDSLYIGREAIISDPGAYMRRSPPAQPNNYFIDDVHVSVTSDNVYQVTIVPFECGYDFPLFELANSRLTSGRTTRTSSRAVMTLENGGVSSTLTVRRSSEASPPVTGYVDVGFDGNEGYGLDILLSTAEFGRELMAIKDIGALSVTKEGDCANFDLVTTFISLPGDLPQMTVNYDRLDGVDATGNVATNEDGGLFYDPLTGDMVSTVHDSPQVRLYINDVPTSCSGDCSFQWDSSVTPSITSVSPVDGTASMGTSIDITGDGFSEMTSGNNVSIGGVDCIVTDSTATTISCNVGNGPAGAYPIIVNVADKGFAQGNVEFTYITNIESVTPASGSLGGGINITINGNGFLSGSAVTINTGTCVVNSLEADEIICTVPASTVAGNFDVEIDQGSLAFSGFTYNSSLTATVDSVVPSQITSSGGNITLSGSSFTFTSGSVFVGVEEATVVSWSDTEIEISVGEIDSGSHEIKIETAYGYAVDSESFERPYLDVDLAITNVYPPQGSLLGGTRLLITGSGFGENVSNVRVSVGPVGCTISSLTTSEIVCDIDDAGTTHYVTNRGVDSAFGVYYAFDEPYIIVFEGDYVQWSWETPVFVNDIAHSITQVPSPSATRAKVGGFSSGTASRNGNYRHQFVRAGIYYVWSGFVDIWGIKNYYGTIEVISASSVSEEVNVEVGKARALHAIGGTPPVDNTDCQSVTTGKPSCTDSQDEVNDPSKFSFTFWSCSTPVVNSVSVDNGTVRTDVVIDGNGFSTTPCQNEVTFGGFNCIVSVASDDSLTCNLEKSGEPELGILHQIGMRVHNRGRARIDILGPEARGFAIMPIIDGITPTSGSLAGGAYITISGFGFGDSPLVTVGGYICNTRSVSYSEIVFESPTFTKQGPKVVEVIAYGNGLALEAECDVTNHCFYTYSKALTPELLDITPASMTGSTTFTIIGTDLGSITTELDVTIGGIAAEVDFANGTAIAVTVDNLPAGYNSVVVRVKDYGKAFSSLSVLSELRVIDISPPSGSIYGETAIAIRGNGFVEGDVAVFLGDTPCDIVSTTLSEINCTTRAHPEESVNVEVITKGISDSSAPYNYSTDSTPSISFISPTWGLDGDILTIQGSNLNGNAVHVLLGLSECIFIAGTSEQINCTIGNHPTGIAPVHVHVAGLGTSNDNIDFEYQLSISSVEPSQGGTAGGQAVVVDGTGFDDSAYVTICGNVCTPTSIAPSTYTCKTPANSEQTCDVAVSLNGLTKTLSSAYTYDGALTPSITGVSPRRGGTGGGTTLTITGSGFGEYAGNVSVEIDGAVCEVTVASDTEIECATGPHVGSVEANVEVQVSANGIAEGISSDFAYIDVWSSQFTWGGGPLPQEGEFVVVPAGMTLLLDIDTPTLDFLLIQGGKLVFDAKDLELNSNLIMITDGGLLQVGTAEEPFTHKATITLHGHPRSKELPIYGAKVLAVRNGTLDLHGTNVSRTWTKLASTASHGSNTLELMDPVDWNEGDEVVIASTGHSRSQSENEKKTIVSKSLDNTTLTLDSYLEADHIGIEEMFDGTLVELRAEVGLLTHNVVVRGNDDVQWHDDIEACPAGFNPGEFATQTCFQGRFGDEIGSSEFGCGILVHGTSRDTNEVKARISNTEVTFAGQAFRLGRYPIHFHLNGDMSQSYVKSSSVHRTFNRAINIHGSHNTLVENTVVYNVMGGAIFLEDGIETGNAIQYNLAVFVKASSSLLNDDITPASYWVTNPDNIIQHNAAAGGTHFGYWYSFDAHPEGPSFTRDVCPVNEPLGVFRNNSAHSFGWYGLWIFESYFPLEGGCAGGDVEPAVFEYFCAWHNRKGAESVGTGALQFVEFVLVENEEAGIAILTLGGIPEYTDESAMVKDTLIVARKSEFAYCTSKAIHFPLARGFRLVNVTFVNFDQPSCYIFGFASITGSCPAGCGGFIYHTERINFVNSPNKAFYSWDWEGIIQDKDGTITNKSDNSTILPKSGTTPTDCEDALEFSDGAPAIICPPAYKWHRFAFKDVVPDSVEGQDFAFSNKFGNSYVPYLRKRVTHKPGWMCMLLSNLTYYFQFRNRETFGNFSWNGRIDDLAPDDYLTLVSKHYELPDRVTGDGGHTFKNGTADSIAPENAQTGDWEWINENNELQFYVHGEPGNSILHKSIQFSSYTCYYPDCITPPDPDTVPPRAARPLSYKYWDDITIWNTTEDGYMTTTGSGGNSTPQDYNNVRVLDDTWLNVNGTEISKLGILLLEGVLEFVDYPDVTYNIEADFIVIKGGRLIIGWPDDPFDGLANIILRGNDSSPYYDLGFGPTLGSKAIGVFGGLDLFGKDVGITWTQLASTASAGTSTIELLDPVGWSPGDDIVLGPTSFNPWETETFRITGIASDNKTLSLNDTLKFKHIAHYETLSNGQELSLGAAVGLLSRNIKVIGEDYPDLYKESYGARVLIGQLIDAGRSYTGYARLSNVEFYHTGQEGFIKDYDPRFSVVFMGVGEVNNVKPSSVGNCSFHHGFNTAIGAFGIEGLSIEGNVVHHTVGDGIKTGSSGTRIIRNLVALVVATASYQDRVEPTNPRWEAGIEAMAASNLILQDNLVTGSERIAFHVPPFYCNDNTTNRYYNNRGFSNLIGVLVFPGESATGGCSMLSDFIVWKSHDFGIYFQDSENLYLYNCLLIENGNAIVSIITGPSALSHVYADKRVFIRNTTLVGQTSSFDCENDVTPSDDNIALSQKARLSPPPTSNWKSGMVGIVAPNFNSGGNGAPAKPFIKGKNYNAIGGLTTISDVTFVNYAETTCKNNYAITPNKGNDDGQHPVQTERISLLDVEESNKVIYHRPNLARINSADCIDMDCDAMKKIMIKDLDGSFLGHVGTVIPQSEFEWNGDPRRGLGDYRIPKEMVTDIDGTRIDYDERAPNKGIIRSENCTYQPAWQAYECFDDINYEMLIIESMDHDTETRRLSPVAILGDGYIDLINGPQDHGWCSGYACRKRISTFMALVATGKEYLLHFTSTTPERMRYRLLNVDPDEGIVLTVWYSRPNRLDVFVNGTYIIATNARIDDNNRYIITMPRGDEFKPRLANGTGTNYFDRDRGEISIVIEGPAYIDVISRSTIIVSFGLPALEVDEFFGENLVENLAAFLDIPLTKVRIMSIVSASGDGRRKRSSDGVIVTVEVGDEPVADVNSTAPDSMDYESLIQVTSDIVNECQVGNVSLTLNVTAECETVSVPSTNSSIPAIVYNTPIPDHLSFYANPEAEYEGVLLRAQPTIRISDAENNVINDVGTAEFPWQMEVSVRAGTGHSSNNFTGTQTVNCSEGWFNFTDLAFSHMGSGYILDFNITYPPGGQSLSLVTAPFDVPGRPLKLDIYEQTTGDLLRDAEFAVTLDIRDQNTEEIITDLEWRDHVWSGNVSLIASSPYGNLSGSTVPIVDGSTGRVLFTGLSMTGYGIYYLQFRVVSDPPDFNLKLNKKVVIKNPAHVGMFINDTFVMKVKFTEVFDTLLPTDYLQNEFEQMILTEFANVWPEVQVTAGVINRGSIEVTFEISGSSEDVNATAYNLCDNIYNGTTFIFHGEILTLSPFLTVNGHEYYGTLCGDLSSDDDDDDDGMAAYLIAIIVIVCVLIVVAVVAVVIWRCSVKPKMRTHDSASWGLATGRSPKDTGMYSVNEKRSMSPFSVRMSTPDDTAQTPENSQRNPVAQRSFEVQQWKYW